MRRVIDISMPLREGMPVYTNNPPFERPVTNVLGRDGSPVNQSKIVMGAHCGTHIDAPWHFEGDGYATDRVPLDHLVGPARVLHFPDVDRIERAALEALEWAGVERVLFRTRNSEHWLKSDAFDPNYCYISGPAARFLAERKLKLVGTDGLGVEQHGVKEFVTHHALLRNGITVLEGLWLADVPPGDYTLFCGPLRVVGGDGAPARALLVREG